MTAEGVVDSCRLWKLDEIVDWIRPHAKNDCLLAIDAPLIVENGYHQRPCEKSVHDWRARSVGAPSGVPGDR